MNDSSCIFELIQQTIQQSANSLSAKELCSIAGVSRSGYYAWIKAAPVRSLQEQKDREDFDLVLSAYRLHGYAKGARGIYMELLHMTPPVIMNLKKIRRLMEKFHLSCPYRGPNPYKRMAKALRTSNVAENLLNREFECYGPRIVLLTDITYLSYIGSFAYLSTILDAFTRQILSYVLSDSLEVDLFLKQSINWWPIMGSHFKQKQSSTVIRGAITPAKVFFIYFITRSCASPCPGVATAGTMRPRRVSLGI